MTVIACEQVSFRESLNETCGYLGNASKLQTLLGLQQRQTRVFGGPILVQ